MTRVLIADDQPVVRAGLRMILDDLDDIEVIGEAADGQEAVNAVSESAPDVVLMDIQMPHVDGIEATRRIQATGSTARVVMLTTYGVDDNIYAALKAGASGFMLKTDHPDHLIHAVRTAAAGTALLSPEATKRLVERFMSTQPVATEPPPGFNLLTEREREVLLEMARGLSNAEIATKLFVSEGTTKTHVARVLAKLQLRDRVQAVVLAYESGLIRPADS